MSEEQTPAQPSKDDSTNEALKSGADIIVDITNGKKVHFNLDPLEWCILLGGISLIIWVVGNSGLV